MARKAAIGLVSFMLLFAIAAMVLIKLNGFPYKYMDLDDSGFITPRETLRALDMGIRDINVSSEECVEVFALKDGLPIKRICPEDR